MSVRSQITDGVENTFTLISSGVNWLFCSRGLISVRHRDCVCVSNWNFKNSDVFPKSGLEVSHLSISASGSRLSVRIT